MPDLYASPGTLSPLTRARASDINARESAVAAAFNKLPDEAQIKSSTQNYSADTGVINSYVVTTPYTVLSYFDGMEVVFKTATSNTGAVSINVNGLGLKSIKFPGNVDPTSGTILTGSYLSVRYDASRGYFVFDSPFQITNNGTLNIVPISILTLVLVAGNTTLVANVNEYAITANAVLTLPASPIAGDIVPLRLVRGPSTLTAVSLARNGLNIMGLAEDYTIDIPYFSGVARYIDATFGWHIS